MSRKQSRNQIRKQKSSVRNGLKDVQSRISLAFPDFGKTIRHTIIMMISSQPFTP